MNDMIVNPERKQERKKKENKHDLNINHSVISSVYSITRLGIEIDNKLNFENHVSNICKKASRQLNPVSRIQRYMGKKAKEIIINTFVYSHYMYCLLAWHFCSKSSQNKNQYRSLKLITDNFYSDYKFLLNETENLTIEIKKLRIIALEIFKTLNNLDPHERYI